MNNDLISRSALLKRFGTDPYFSIDPNDRRIFEIVTSAPTVDAEVVRHGRYGFVGMDMMAGARAFYFGTCSECRNRINFEYKHNNYCPNCGAKMDGDEHAD